MSKIIEKLSKISKNEALDLLASDEDQKYSQAGIYMFSYFPEHIRNDIEVATLAIEKNGYGIKFLSKELKANKNLALKAVASNYHAIDYVAEQLKDDKDIAMLLMSKNSMLLSCLSARLRSDKDVVLAAVHSNFNSIKFAMPIMQDNEEVVIAAVTNEDINNYSLSYASDRLKNKKEIIALFFKRKYPEVNQLLKDTQSDRDFILAFTKKYVSLLGYASNEIKDDKEIVMTSIRKGDYIYFASDHLKDDNDVAFLALDIHPYSLKDVSNRLKDNKDLVLLAVSKDYTAYLFASDRLKLDNDIILAGAKNNVLIVDHFPIELKEDLGDNEIIDYFTKKRFSEYLNSILPDKPLTKKNKI